MPSDTDWLAPAPALDAGTVHLWRISLEQSTLVRERLARSLDASERTRAARFAFGRDRERFLVAHGALRTLLAPYVARQPEALRFVVSAQGKPEIGDADAQNGGALRFSLAHSGEIALVAVTRIGAIGVDVEQMRAEVEALALAERFFAPEEFEALRALSEDRRLGNFYTLWTCKEAYLKAQGVGLTGPLHHVRVHLNDEAAPTITLMEAEAASHWSLTRVTPSEGYTGAVAVDGIIEQLALLEWTSDAL